MSHKPDYVVLAGMVHDSGKLFERGEIFFQESKEESALSCCPFDPKSGRRTHLHAAFTRCFCDWLEERFDCLRQAPDRAWKDWAAAHHSDEPDLPFRVIRLADRYSAQEREPGQFYISRVHQRTYLEPIIERVSLTDDSPVLATSHRHPLRPAGVGRSDLFPVDGKQLGVIPMNNAGAAIQVPSAWSHLIASQDRLLTKEYATLGSGLLKEIDAVARKTPALEIRQLLVTLSTLLERYTANVPSATNVRHPDISLFDHMRTTAAIAQGLYLQQIQQAVPHQGVEDRDEKKWLLACGDFSGIQKFIYRLINKGAAKGLRGRSFYVQIFCRMSADFILRSLDLARPGLLYNSGGKFYLLVPVHLKARLFEAREKINRWLVERYGGEVFLGVGTAGITGEMFVEGRMHAVWDAVQKDLERDRLTSFKELVTRDSSFFAPQIDFDPTKSCSVCGARSALSDLEDRVVCEDCRGLERIGKDLGRAQALLMVWGAGQIQKVAGMTKLKPYRFDSLESALFMLPKTAPEKRGDSHPELLSGLPLDAEMILLNQEFGDMPADHPLPGCSIETLYLGTWKDRFYDEEGEPWDFEHYANNSAGIKRLGILRMDVDNLGMVFIRGLKFPMRSAIQSSRQEGKPQALQGWGDVMRKDGKIQLKPMASLSRMATLSRQLNAFFSGYVPSMLENDAFNRCQVIYAGGDDLFVIGSWDQLPTLAKRIREDFATFCCGNPHFTISGGLTLVKPRYPMYRGAKLAGEAETMAKNLRRAWKESDAGAAIMENELQKDAFCFLGVPVTWNDWALVDEMKDMLLKEVMDGKNKGFLAYLRQLAAGNAMQVKNLQLVGNLDLPDAWKKLEYDRWRWVTAYQLRRRFNDKTEGGAKREKWSQVLFSSKLGDRQSDLPAYSWLELPVRWVEYLSREGGGRNE